MGINPNIASQLRDVLSPADGNSSGNASLAQNISQMGSKAKAEKKSDPVADAQEIHKSIKGFQISELA